MSTHLSRPSYRPDIDGLRGIAVISVVAFHAFPTWLPGGFVGVDIFFVISGYLISLIIFSSLAERHYSFAEFYSRRIKRIFPALIAVLVASMAFGWYALYAKEFSQLGEHAAGGAGFVSNFILWAETGYFNTSASTKPLLHLWTLAIEEQFYIFWPILLLLVWKRGWSFLVTTSAVAIVSFLVNILMIHRNPTAAFYFPASRWWELMIGGLLACVTMHHPTVLGRWRTQCSVIGLALLAISLFAINSKSIFPGYLALLPTFGAFLLISAQNSLINRRILSAKALVWFGLISYPLYLWHWPLIAFGWILKGGLPGRGYRLGTVFAAIALAWATYELVEKPIRFGAYAKQKTLALAGGMACVLVISLLCAFQAIAPRHDNATLRTYTAALGDWSYPASMKQRPDGGPTGYYVNSSTQKTTLLFGDSHIEQYAPRINSLIENNPKGFNSAIFVTGGGCVPIPGAMEDAPIHKECKVVMDYGLALMRQPFITNVIIGACWNCYFIAQNKPSNDDYYTANTDRAKHFNGNETHVALASLGQLISEISKTKRVYLLLDNPYGYAFDPRSFFTNSRLGAWHTNPVSHSVRMDPEQTKLRDQLISIATTNGARIIDPTQTLCHAGWCDRTDSDGDPLYKDVSHLRPLYVRDHANFMDDALL